MSQVTIVRILTALCLVSLAPSGCIEEKEIDIVITGETSASFAQNESVAEWGQIAIIDVAQEMRDMLAEQGYQLSDLKQAKVTAASYGVTSFDQSHDWAIAGIMMVTYGALSGVLVDYTLPSVRDALGQKIAAPLQATGVNVINAALQDFMNGEDAILTFGIVNESTTPAPSILDPIVFEWQAWLAVQVIIQEVVEVPDPF
jgi:hypothetical protein